MKYYLAIDIGASSRRRIVGYSRCQKSIMGINDKIRAGIKEKLGQYI